MSALDLKAPTQLASMRHETDRMLLNFWVAHWIGCGSLMIDCRRFIGKQLMAVDILWASFRASRSLPFDDPYASAFRYTKPIHKDFWKRKGLLFFLNRYYNNGATIIVGSVGLDRGALLVVQLLSLFAHILSNLIAGLVLFLKMI